DVAGLTLNQLFADLNQDVISQYIPSIQSNAAVAQSFGIELTTYEGGQSMYSPNDLNYAVKEQSMYDPRMYQLYVTMMDYWYQYAGANNLFMLYDFSDVDSDSGFWGLLQQVGQPGSQKWDAIISQLLPAGDANLDGVVNYADFQILAANYGIANTYWDQG